MKNLIRFSLIGLTLLVGIFGLVSLTQGAVQPGPDSTNRDRFGGYTKIQAAKTGRWYLTVINGQHTFVTPDGNAFTVEGLNKVATHNFYPEDFKTVFGTKNKWAKQAISFLKDSRFNLIGHLSDLETLRGPGVSRMPYMVSPQLIQEEPAERDLEDWKDPWSAEFLKSADDRFKLIKKKYDRDPYFSFIIAGNEFNAGLKLWDGTPNMVADWPWVLIDEEGRTPAKDVWVSMYRDQFYQGNVEEMNRVYGLSMTSFDEMYTLGSQVYHLVWAEYWSGIDVPGTEQGRAYDEFQAWSDAIHIQYAKVIYETSKKWMPDRLVGAAKLQGNDLWSDNVLAGMGRYSDFVNINNYSVEPYIDRYQHMFDVTQKPVLVSEFGFLREPCNGPYPGVPTSEERATNFLRFRNTALGSAVVLGTIDHEYHDPVDHNPANPCGYLEFGLLNKHAQVYQSMMDTGAAEWSSYDVVRWQREIRYVSARGRDSDGDRKGDRDELLKGTDPFSREKLPVEWNHEDADGDGVNNGTEIKRKTNPYGPGIL